MSPATPSPTGGGHALGMHSTSSTSGSSYDTSGSHSALSTQIEPSPASTYGSSAASDAGIPLTPDNDGALLTNVAHLSIDDHRDVGGNVRSSGHHSTSSSRNSNRYSPPFVRNGAQSNADDPFQSPSKNSSKYRNHDQHTPKAPRHSQRDIHGPWRSTSSSNSSESSSSKPKSNHAGTVDTKYGETKRKLSFHVQEHVSEETDTAGNRLSGYTVVKAEDAQAVYPPSCCVFVANLLQSENEDSLQMAVTQVFREYGPVYVKIRRDGKHMPFAFCQYTKQEHAEKAIKEGRGRLIKGRPCRCEKAKAHRLFFIERKYGPVVTPSEARDLLQRFGKIELCYTASHVERTALNLNEGVIVQFEMYDEGQDAQSAFRNHELYKLQPIAGLAAPAQQSPPAAEVDATKAYLARYDVDRRSIFVGNLPLGTSEQQIRGLFEHYGDIQDISLRENASKFEPEEKFAFAFVEFKSPIAVVNAVNAKNGITFGGKSLRVAQKDSENGGSRGRSSRSQPLSSTRSFQSPRVDRRVEQQVSPSAQMSPMAYASPYGYTAYSPYYGYAAPSTVFTDGQGHYYSSATSYSPAPAYYPGYPTSPGYGMRNPAVATDLTGSPAVPSPYCSYAPYQQYPSAPYWGMQSPPADQLASSQQAYYPYSPINVGNKAHDDRSATPTPSGHAAVVE
ncbi:uncharacterized protein EAF01_000339 [Botrytis porri]|uniref:RRM domain-containing protein n=1 Tax=Botrytis porri TaxID=87229 RepID=A0A4Z1L530_9HELO|nr:uncharacterized protein EAF01_000339 [Botrytis porri]KAF7913933.1 hypothetical protein EAF01_000339 [Botrytis porri]TGO91934.1 hypothetical protein BPOR_0014g00070 [Botrytis porri]